MVINVSQMLLFELEEFFQCFSKSWTDSDSISSVPQLHVGQGHSDV